MSETYAADGQRRMTAGGILITVISGLSALLLVAALVYAAGIGPRHVAALAAADCEPNLTPAGMPCTTQPMLARRYAALMAPASQQLTTDAVGYAGNGRGGLTGGGA